MVRSARSNAQAARDDAASLLRKLTLPSGATPSTGEPTGDDGALAAPAMGRPATPNAVDDHAWWVLPDSPDSVLAYVKAHPPAGSTAFSSGTGGGGSQPTESSIGLGWPPITGELGTRWLIVGAVQLANGSTGVRADSEVVWITPRPPSERVPRRARRVVVTNTRGGTVVQGPFTVTSRAMVARIVSLLNGLPAWQPGVYSCPADFGWRVRVAFYGTVAASSVPPLAVAVVTPTGCGVVQLSLAGKRQRPLADGYEAANRITKLLGVKFDTGAPHGNGIG